MTITLNPDQEEAVRAAIRGGQVASVEELINRALAGLSAQRKTETPAAGRPVAQPGLGLLGSPKDAALLDEAEKAQAAAELIRELRKGVTLDRPPGMSLREYAHSGHKY